MDNVTHTLFALTLARTRLGRAGRGTTAALVLASNAPDVDVVTALKGGLHYLAWHRGPTHGPLGILGLGLATATIVWSISRVLDRRRVAGTGAAGRRASFAALLGLSLVGITAHILMDLPTSYGTRLLSPFSWRWFAVDWMPIVDIYLLLALAAGLLFGRTSAAARRPNIAIVLVLMALNYGVRGVAHHEALRLAPRLFGPALPSRCDPDASEEGLVDSWPRRPTLISAIGEPCLVEIAVMPTFLSPFRWRVIASLSNAYEVQDLNVLDRRFRTTGASSEASWPMALRWPNPWTAAVAQAAMSPAGRVFLGFARFPVARALVDPNGMTTVVWTDMRFVGGPLTLQPPARQADPLGVTIQVGADNQILREQFGP